MTQQNNPKRNNLKRNQGLDSEVYEWLKVSADGDLYVCLEMKAHNRTNEPIFLSENYFIRCSQAFNVAAYDLDNKRCLTAFHDAKRKRVEIIFPPDTVLPPAQTLRLRVSFVTKRFRILEKDSDTSTGIFGLIPLRSYAGVPIRNHRMRLRVDFLRPKAGESFRNVSISQSNNREVRAKFVEKRDRMEVTFDPFDLPRGNNFRVTFNYRYESSFNVLTEKSSSGQKVSRRHLRTAFSTTSGIVLAVLPGVIKELIVGLFRR